MVEQLTLLQIDPTAAVAPNVDLVCWSRLGNQYRPDHLREALEVDRTLFELDALIRPTSDLPIHRAAMAGFPSRQRTRAWLKANARFRRDVLDLLGASGPLLSRDIPDTAAQPWESTGWTNNRNVTMMLETLARKGDVAIAGRKGKQRVWDLAERVYPASTPTMPAAEAERLRNARRLRSLGIARERTTAAPLEPWDVGPEGEEAVIKGVSGTWRVDPAALGQPFKGRTALLSPFDRLVHDRVRAQEIFDFEYVLEMYKPQDQRRWGYFALPILHRDQLVGKLDAKADHKAGVFRVNAIHEDVPFNSATKRAVLAEIEKIAEWLKMELGKA